MSKDRTEMKLKPRKNFLLLLLLLGAALLIFLALYPLVGTSSGKVNPGAVIDSFITDVHQGHRRCLKETTVSTFNEKVRWRMNNDHRAIWGVVVDKLHGKLYAERIEGVRPVPTWWSTRIYQPEKVQSACAEMPRLAELPGSSFAFKATHTALCNLCVVDGTIVAHRRCATPPASLFGAAAFRDFLFRYFGSYFIDREPSLVGKRATTALLKRQCSEWLNQAYYRASKEWAYARASEVGGRGVLIEPVLTNRFSNPSPPHLAADLKCYTFDGKTQVLHYVTGRFVLDGKQRKKDTFFFAPEESSQWTVINVTIDGSTFETDPRKHPPQSLMNRAKEICNSVGAEYDFARVDLLWSSSTNHGATSSNNELHLGEITPYPGGGYHAWKGKAPDLDVLFGKSWCLPADFSSLL